MDTSDQTALRRAKLFALATQAMRQPERPRAKPLTPAVAQAFVARGLASFTPPPPRPDRPRRAP
ncbi:hypothetical protein ATO8_02115 [Roseivivax marinus]|uniref:Uncharacterized protein n=1 Tax=Roseivivax marinus TaxID=1379903 RepID=W4HPN5_9RHOB|nr:hypothetical protein ATO8_02115 [Roseivivax marinus]